MGEVRAKEMAAGLGFELDSIGSINSSLSETAGSVRAYLAFMRHLLAFERRL